MSVEKTDGIYLLDYTWYALFYMISKIILVVLGLLSLGFGLWAGMEAFRGIGLVGQLGLMGMMGSLFQSVIIFASLTFPTKIRRTITLLLLTWHIPETLLIATVGMGIPENQQTFGILLHGSWCVLALLSWYLAKEE